MKGRIRDSAKQRVDANRDSEGALSRKSGHSFATLSF